MRSENQNSESAAIEQTICERAANYFPKLSCGSVDVKCRRVQTRRFSTLYEFDVCPTRQLQPQTLIVKVASDFPSEDRSLIDRSNLLDISPTPDPAGYEHDALVAIERHFSDLGDPRFGAVRVVDTFLNRRAVVMEKLAAPTLRTGLLWASRVWPRRTPPALGVSFSNTGAWLRHFHEMPRPEHCAPVSLDRTDFEDQVLRLSKSVDAPRQTVQLFRDAADEIVSQSRRMLPDVVRAGLVHGDFAPRNVLFEHDGRVSVIDTLAYRTGPIYEDIAHFLIALKTNKLLAYSRGCALSARLVSQCENDFLNGYFGRDVPRLSIRLFELQALLMKWAVAMRSARRNSTSIHLAARAHLFATRAFYSRSVRRLLNLLDQKEESTNRAVSSRKPTGVVSETSWD